MKRRLDRDILLQTLRGYAEVNAIADAERRAQLATMTREASWAIFDSLYAAWEQTGRRAGGDWEALDRQHIEETIALRRVFEALARHKGLI